MGTDNVIYLAQRADLAVPTYRRARRVSSPTAANPLASAHGEGAWHALARQRGAHMRALAPTLLRPVRAPADSAPAGAALEHDALVDEGRCATVAGTRQSPGRDVHGCVAPVLRPSPEATPGTLRSADAGVRVAQPVDATRSAGLLDGRLRISGRLIDVCAELERLAAAETRAALAQRA